MHNLKLYEFLLQNLLEVLYSCIHCILLSQKQFLHQTVLNVFNFHTLASFPNKNASFPASLRSLGLLSFATHALFPSLLNSF